MDAVFIRARQPEEARAILDAAFQMAEEITSDEREWCHVFDKAVELLSQGQLLIGGPQVVPIDLSKIRTG